MFPSAKAFFVYTDHVLVFCVLCTPSLCTFVLVREKDERASLGVGTKCTSMYQHCTVYKLQTIPRARSGEFPNFCFRSHLLLDSTVSANCTSMKALQTLRALDDAALLYCAVLGALCARHHDCTHTVMD